MYEIEQVVLQSRPGKTNPPSEENFAYAKAPPIECKDGEIIAKTLYLSVDPYMRLCLNDPTGVASVSPWPLNKVVQGLGGVGVVVESKLEGFVKGDVIQPVLNGTVWPWKNYAVFSSVTQVQKVENTFLREHPSLLLGLCGITGLTALVGLEEKGHIVPGKNQTVFVSGAAGACGSAAGQIAKLLGSGKVVGTCGTDEKCQYIVQELGFDAAINYKTTTDMGSAINKHCPGGIDVYFDNVGGTISEEVIRQMNKDSHIVLCGQISQYNDGKTFPELKTEIQEILTKGNITRDGFMFLGKSEVIPMAMQKLTKWVEDGKLKSRETVAVGLENTGKAFVSMMKGGNIGKQIVKVSDH